MDAINAADNHMAEFEQWLAVSDELCEGKTRYRDLMIEQAPTAEAKVNFLKHYCENRLHTRSDSAKRRFLYRNGIISYDQ